MSEKKQQKRPYSKDAIWLWLGGFFTLAVFLVCLVSESGLFLPLRILGVLFLLQAGLFFLWPVFTLKEYGGNPDAENYMHTIRVVDKGLFGILRHPQYLGYMLYNLGFSCLYQHFGVVILAGLAIMAFYMQTRVEERMLVQRFDHDYLEYCERVPRLNWLLGLVRRYRRQQGCGSYRKP